MPSQHDLRSFAATLSSSHARQHAAQILAKVLEHAERMELDFTTIAARCGASEFKLAKWKSGELKAEQPEAEKVVEQICLFALEEQAKMSAAR